MSKSITSKGITETNPRQLYNALWRLEKVILDSLDFTQVVQKVVDSLLEELEYMKLGYEIIVLALVEEEKHFLKRISISKTSSAEKALKYSPIPFPEIDISLSEERNLCIKALNTGKPYSTEYWPDILTPPFTVDQATNIQSRLGIKNSMVFPIVSKGESLGIIIFSLSKDMKDVSEEEHSLISRFTDVVGLAVQNSRLYSSLEQRTRELGKANKELKQLDSQKDEFISIASHELKTPISIIKTNLWMFKHVSEKDFTEKQNHFITEMDWGILRLSKLVNNLLDISRIQEGRFVLDVATTNIDEVICNSINNFKEASDQKGLKLIPPKTKVGNIIVDKDRLTEVLDNFISNAIKYTEKGGVKVTSHDQKDEVKINITDTGPGIAKEDMGRIFKKFGRAKEGLKRDTVGSSTGLGLYINKRILAEMGGKVGVNSRVGKGSTFWFTIPKKPNIGMLVSKRQNKKNEAIKNAKL